MYGTAIADTEVNPNGNPLSLPSLCLSWWSPCRRNDCQGWTSPQNSLCSSSFQISRGYFMAANLKQFLGTKITEMGRVISQRSCSLARGSSSMSNCLVWMLSTEHSLKSFASQAACWVVKQLTWFSLLEIWNALINLLSCDFCEHFLMQMITPVEIKLLIGAGTWHFPFFPMGCDTGKWSLCFKPFSAFPFHYLKQNVFSWKFF